MTQNYEHANQPRTWSGRPNATRRGPTSGFSSPSPWPGGLDFLIETNPKLNVIQSIANKRSGSFQIATISGFSEEKAKGQEAFRPEPAERAAPNLPNIRRECSSRPFGTCPDPLGVHYFLLATRTTVEKPQLLENTRQTHFLLATKSPFSEEKANIRRGCSSTLWFWRSGVEGWHCRPLFTRYSSLPFSLPSQIRLNPGAAGDSLGQGANPSAPSGRLWP